MRRLVLAAAPVALALAVACVEPADVPSNVHDLRVLGARLDPPEMMAPSCEGDPLSLLPSYQRRLDYTALVLDPAGEGRPVRVDLSSCPATDGGVCDAPEETFQLVPPTEVAPGEVTFDLGLFAFTGAPEKPLLLETLRRDRFGGLGGVRVPLVLHVRAGDEELFARKLMLFTCRFFPEMAANVNPELPGVTAAGVPWAAGEVLLFEGTGAVALEPLDFAHLEEPYVAPSFDLQPVPLVESWRLAWHADYGTIAPYETGGTDLGGGEGRHRVEWTPPPNATERDVRFWIVVRDGRGGTSWITRTAHLRP